ncbi:MAG TPA: aminopeptidase, partial [Parasegetibacter sp.]
MFRSYLIFTSLILILFSCKQSTPPESGVPLTLAQERKAFISDVKYQLALNIPNNPEEAIKGNETVHFNSKKELKDVVLDFRQRENSVKSVRANGEQIKVRHENEHIIIPAKYIREGENNIEIEFEAGSSALNRNKEYMYALFVPDRARTAFPCFDQPDMKAVYELTLTIPANWEAMSNADIRSAETTGETKIVHFEPSDLISTYLFSFTAGVYKVDRRVVDGREMEFFYRETDSVKLKASVPAIFEMHA